MHLRGRTHTQFVMCAMAITPTKRGQVRVSSGQTSERHADISQYISESIPAGSFVYQNAIANV